MAVDYDRSGVSTLSPLRISNIWNSVLGVKKNLPQCATAKNMGHLKSDSKCPHGNGEGINKPGQLQRLEMRGIMVTWETRLLTWQSEN